MTDKPGETPKGGTGESPDDTPVSVYVPYVPMESPGPDKWPWAYPEITECKDTTTPLVEAEAYRLWEEAGKPDGRDVEFWAQAERNIVGYTCGEMDDAVRKAAAEPEYQPDYRGYELLARLRKQYGVKEDQSAKPKRATHAWDALLALERCENVVDVMLHTRYDGSRGHYVTLMVSRHRGDSMLTPRIFSGYDFADAIHKALRWANGGVTHEKKDPVTADADPVKPIALPYWGEAIADICALSRHVGLTHWSRDGGGCSVRVEKTSGIETVKRTFTERGFGMVLARALAWLREDQ